MVANLLIGVIQLVVYIWTVITLPFYFIAYMPWRKTRAFHRKRAAAIDSKPSEVLYRAFPRSPSESKLRFRFLDAVNEHPTMDRAVKYIFEKHADKRCLGVRAILEEKKVPGPNGKEFTKLVQDTKYKWMSYTEVDQKATAIGRGLRLLGIQARDKLVMYCDTKAEWMITAIGCFKFNVTLVTIYTNLGEDGVAYGINQTQAGYVVTSQELLPKLIKILDKLPTVHTILVIEEPHKGEVPLLDGKYSNEDTKKSLYTWKSVFTSGLKASGGSTTEPGPDDTAILMYTSGSTGNPKGVMLTHSNLVYALASLIGMAEQGIPNVREEDAYIAYLPLAHVLELLAEHVMLLLGVGIGYSSPNTLTNNSTMVMPGASGDAAVLKPSVMTAVPVILDRIYKGIKNNVAAGGPFKAKLVDFCIRYRANWVRRGYDTPIMNKLIFSKIKAIVGGRVRLLLSGGAPLAEEAHQFIRTALGISLHQGYGLTETAATATITDVDDLTLGTVGTPLQGIDIRLVDWSEGGYTVKDSQGPRGEIIVGGKHVASGYYNMPDKTAEDFYDADGTRWFKTGDIGQAMPDGTIKIIDRKKDLVKLQMGEYVSLGKVESNLKIYGFVENICVCARPSESFTVALIVPDEAKLQSMVGEKVGVKDSLHTDPSVIKEVIKQLTAHGLSMGLEKFEIPKQVTLLDEQWTPESGVVTAAMKLKRKEIDNRYKAQIDAMYDPAINAKEKDGKTSNNNNYNNNKVAPV